MSTRPERFFQVFFKGVTEEVTPEVQKELWAAIQRKDEWWTGENAYGGEVSIRISAIDALIECSPETRLAYHDSVIENRKANEASTAYPGETPLE